MNCTNGHENADDQAFCGTCGVPLTPPDPAVDARSSTASPPTRKHPPLVIVAYAALAAAFVGSFLPWARVLFVTVNGTDGDGVITALTAAGAALCMFLGTREEPAQRKLLVAAFLLSIACAGVYLYDANQLVREYGEDAGMFGEITVQPQMGLYLGALGSILAVGSTGIRAAQEHRPGILDGLPAPTYVALAAALYAIALIAVPGWWGLTTLAALIAISVGFVQRRQAAAGSTSLRPATFALAAGIVGLLGGIGGFVIDGDQGTDIAECTEVFADGATTQRSWDEDGVTCLDRDGERTFTFTMEAFCWEQDEAPLANDYGWGYVDEPWHAGEDAPDC
ncbi:MAG TPA: hypothetical protein VLR27_07415 [Acidimicrobiales bacterium]|nr:hypothetical protein [Acidimicrobiales bacterium]